MKAKLLPTPSERRTNWRVLHKGCAYGFDNTIFTCIDLENGKRRWKGGRYEKGQALLLADSGLIVVLSERGELVLLLRGGVRCDCGRGCGRGRGWAGQRRRVSLVS